MKSKKDDFKYLVDEFADIKILRYQVPGFNELTLKQKIYVYYLSEATKCGRDILWNQKNKCGLIVRRVLENIILTFKGNKKLGGTKIF